MMEIIEITIDGDLGQNFELEAWLNGIRYATVLWIAQSCLEGEFDDLLEFAFQEAEEELLAKVFETGKD